MPPQDDEFTREVAESAGEARGEDTAADIAHASQEKPQDLTEKEQKHSELRKQGLTPSSVDLPHIDVSLDDDGKIAVKIASKSFKVDPADIMKTGLDKVLDFDGERAGVMGRAGDRSRDSGLGKPTNTDVTTDEQGRVTSFKVPGGSSFEVEYGFPFDTPVSLTMTESGSEPVTFDKGFDGQWRNRDNPDQALEEVSFDPESKNVTVRIEYVDHGLDKDIILSPDGTYEEQAGYGFDTGKTNLKIQADGTIRRYDREAGTEVVSGSHIAEIKALDGGASKGYEVTDDQGHVTKIENNSDGTVSVKRGDRTERYANAHFDETTGLKLVGRIEADGKGGFKPPDESTVQITPEGTEITRDRAGKICTIVNSDGETTEFKRAKDGTVKGLTVTDGQGRIVETRNQPIEVDDSTGNYTFKLDKSEAEARKAEGAGISVDKLERTADGTERLLAQDGSAVKSDADVLLEKFKNYTPEQQRELRQDLADIDKLEPPERREAVYRSLDKIARNDEHPGDKIRLTGQQARELVQSLAHQVAHPESILQGYKMTCAIANAEQTMARNHPEGYADMVAKLATEGKYTTHDGRTIESQTGADETSLAGKTDWFGQRSYASELFQNGVVNLGLPEGARYDSYPPGHPALNPRPDEVTPANDMGERVRYPDGRVTAFEGLWTDQQAEVLNHLVKDGNYGPQPVKEAQDLADLLVKNDGMLNVGISLERDLAKTGMGAGEGAGTSGYHAVNITHVDIGPPDMVYYENPAGGADHSYPHGQGISADAFISAMYAGEADMQALVRGAGTGADHPGDGKMGNPKTAGSDKPMIKTADAASDAHLLKSLRDDPEVKEHHKKLEQMASDMKEPGRSQFLRNMAKFEEREAKQAEQYQKQFEAKGMNPEEAAREGAKKAQEQVEYTYKNMERLLEKRDKLPVDQADRILLAQQSMQHCADTTSVSQGRHGSCFAATVESRTYSQDPAEATRLIADVATTGKYTSKGSKPVTVDMTKDDFSLKKQSDSLDVPRKDGRRDFASQIFQVTAGNVALEIDNMHLKPKGQLRYEQHPRNEGAIPKDNGERVMDHSTTPAKEVTHSLGRSAPEIAELSKHISPGSSEGWVSLSEPAQLGVMAQLYTLDKRVLERSFTVNGMDGDLNFDEKDPDRFEKMHQAIDKNTALDAKTREELHKAVSEVDKDARRLGEMGNLHVMDENTMKYVLAKAKAEGNLPIIVAVDTINEPFWTDSGGGRADGSGGAHVITITDFDGKTGMAKIQNQWDKSANHDISVRDLTTAIHGNEGHKLEILDKRAAKYRSEGRPDFNMEYDVLQLKHSTGKISDAEYDQQIIALTVERAKEYLKLGKATTEDRQEEYQKATGKVVAMIKEIERKDPERAKKIKDDVRKQLA